MYLCIMYVHTCRRKYDKMITHMYYDIDISRKTTNFLVTKTNVRKSIWILPLFTFKAVIYVNYTDSIKMKKKSY